MILIRKRCAGDYNISQRVVRPYMALLVTRRSINILKVNFSITTTKFKGSLTSFGLKPGRQFFVACCSKQLKVDLLGFNFFLAFAMFSVLEFFELNS